MGLARATDKQSPSGNPRRLAGNQASCPSLTSRPIRPPAPRSLPSSAWRRASATPGWPTGSAMDAFALGEHHTLDFATDRLGSAMTRADIAVVLVPELRDTGLRGPLPRSLVVALAHVAAAVILDAGSGPPSRRRDRPVRLTSVRHLSPLPHPRTSAAI